MTSVIGGSGRGIDSAGDVINYSIAVTNSGNTALTGLTVTDRVESTPVVNATPVMDGAFNSGDTNDNGVFDAGETWNFTASYTVQQSDIDNDGSGGFVPDGEIDNFTTADTDQTELVFDIEMVQILAPAMTIEKVVTSVTNGDGTVDSDGQADSTTDVISYSVTVTNTGEVPLEDIVVTDSLGGSLGTIATLGVGETSAAFNYSYSPTQADLDSNGGGDGDIDNPFRGPSPFRGEAGRVDARRRST